MNAQLQSIITWKNNIQSKETLKQPFPYVDSLSDKQSNYQEKIEDYFSTTISNSQGV